MSTRELRPRTGKITGSFNTSKLTADTSKLAVKKKGGPQKFAKVENTPAKEPNVKSGNFTSDQTSSSSSAKAEPTDDDHPGEKSDSSLSPVSSPSPGPPPSSKHKAKTKKALPMKKSKLKYPPGTTPYPEYSHPTPSECLQVTALLTAAHGSALRPETVPKPDNDVAGCGHVPAVVDALCRTVLSANTTSANSTRAFKGLVDKFGIIPCAPDVELGAAESVQEEGERRIKMARKIGEGSVDWDNVRKAPMKEVVEAIRSGGMAVMKAKHIKNIMDIAYEEDRALKRAKKEEAGVKIEATDDDEGEVSLEYLRDLPDDDVMAKLMSFDGVGCKTASCVAMFCLGRPKFPVDTHVWRISKYLSWLPESATREDAYHHLDTRIPNDLKFQLHCLLIRHGRTCKHCKAGPQASGVKQAPKRSREDEGEWQGEVKKVKTRKVWVGTGMMKEVVVEVPDDGVEGGEEGLESCVLEELIKKRVRQSRRG